MQQQKTEFQGPSPIRIFVYILSCVAAAEVVVMAVLGALDPGAIEPWHSLADASLLILVSTPLLYVGALRPLLAQARKVAEQEALLKAYAEKEALETALREREASFALLFENVSDLIFVLTADGDDLRFAAVNRAFCDVTGLAREQVVGRRVEEVLPPTAAARALGRYREALRAGASIRYEEDMEMPSGRLTVEATLTPVCDPAGRRTHLVGIARDVTERKRLERELRHLADHDPLTGLPNRRLFELELSRALEAAGGRGGALLLLDLDHFKYVNDIASHREGDRYLAALAGSLRKCLREGDVLARLGGDEFAALLPGAGAAEAQAVARRILGRVRRTRVTVAGEALHLTASIGIALFPQHGRRPSELLSRADVAMYQAKERGRNQVCLYAAEGCPHAEMRSRLAWVTRIREALAEDRFVLYLQPILDLRQDRVTQYEVLLRMTGRDGALVPPAAFLDAAEQFGLVREVDRWVVRRAIRLIAEQRQAGRDLCLEVNLSGKAFSDPELLQLVRQELSATGVDPALLIFEITETAAVANLEQARGFIAALRSLGCRFGLDDFGVGFSSFNYLKQLPVDYLKIDGSFVRNLTHSETDQHLVKAIVQVAKGLGKETVAEFVGDEETLRLVKEFGVDYAQGYHVGLPRPAEEVLAPAAPAGERAAAGR